MSASCHHWIIRHAFQGPSQFLDFAEQIIPDFIPIPRILQRQSTRSLASARPSLGQNIGIAVQVKGKPSPEEARQVAIKLNSCLHPAALITLYTSSLSRSDLDHKQRLYLISLLSTRLLRHPPNPLQGHFPV